MGDNYLGCFVFVERIKGSNYNNGEYFIVQQTPHNLYGVKMVGGYGCHELHKFALEGEEAYRVISSYKDDQAARFSLADLKHFAETPKRGEKLAWIESLYGQAASNARLVERVLGLAVPPNIKTLATVVTDGKQVWLEP